MENLIIVLEKIIYLILLLGCGMLAKGLNLISDKGIDDLSKLVVDFFWPALIFYQITSSLNADDIIKNSTLPLFAVVTAITGYLIGVVIVKVAGYKNEEKKIFLYNSTVNNFVFMVIPFIELFLPKNGLGLLFIHNIGYILIIWTLGVTIFQGKFNLKNTLRGLINPGFIATIVAIIITITNLNKHLPVIVFDTFKTIGAPTVAVAMIVAGAQIYKLGKEALKFDMVNILIGLNRLVLVPGILLGLSFLLKNYFSKEVIIIFMIVNAMPVSIISVSMAMRYNSRADLASQQVVSNHLFSILTIPVFIVLIKIFFF